MTSKIVKVIGGAVVGLLTLTTTVTAGYKVYKNNTVKAELPDPTPEVIEQIKNVQEVVTLPSATNSPTTNSPLSSQAPSPTFKPTQRSTRFNDDDDDEVEFETHKTETPEPRNINDEKDD